MLRQAHLSCDKLLVDYAGHTLPVIDRLTGEVRQAQLFVAVLGASNTTYAEAIFSQAIHDRLGSHVRLLQHFGGAPLAIVPDNLKSAVARARRYEPDLNPAYQEFAEHYRLAILPTRVRNPRDKAKVEAGVLMRAPDTFKVTWTKSSSCSLRLTRPFAHYSKTSTPDLIFKIAWRWNAVQPEVLRIEQLGPFHTDCARLPTV